MIVLIWILNFAISIFNAWSCGKTWNESKYAGGMPHFMNWMGAIMSASGFTWCYLVIAVFVGGTYPIEHDDGTMAPLLTVEQVQATADLGYLVVLMPILGSGLAITIHAWGVAYRRRTLGDGAIAAWDTFAMVYNVSSALRHVPQATDRLGDFFFGGETKDAKGRIVLILVAVCVLGGVLTTYFIITRTARATARVRGFKYQLAMEADAPPGYARR